MATSLILGLALTCLPPAAADAGDEQYAYVVGLCEKGLFEMAAREAQAFLRDHPRHERADDARYRLAGAWFELDAFEEAAGEYRRLTRRPRFELAPEAWFRLGQCEAELGRPQPAAEAFGRARSGGRDYLRWPATHHEADARFRLGQHDDAERLWTEVARAGDEAAADYRDEAAWGLAWCAFETGRHAECLRRADAFLADWPEHALGDDVRFLAGESALELGRARDALAYYEAVGPGPRRAAAQRGGAYAWAELGEPARAAAAFEALLAADPEGPYAREAALQRGVQLLAAGRADEAVRALSDARLADDAEAARWRVRAERAAGRSEAALETVRAALARARDPEEVARLRTEEAETLAALGHHADAARSYEAAGTEYARHAAVVAWVNAGGFERAERAARAFLAEHPGSAYRVRVELSRGEALFGLERWDAAVEVLAPVAAQTEDAAAARRARSRTAWARYLAGDPAGAEAGFAALAREDEGPDGDEARFMAAVCARELGADDRARRGFEQYLAERPDGARRAEARLALAELVPGRAGDAQLESVLDEADPAAVPTALLALADRHAAAGRRDEARAAYGALLADHADAPEAPAARYGLAWMAFEDERFGEAAEHVARLRADVELDPELARAALELDVFCAERQGRPDDALAALQALAGSGAEESRVFAAARSAGRAFVAAGRAEFADRMWRELGGALRAAGHRAGAATERAWIALDGGDRAAAEARAREALAIAPDDPGALEAAFFVGEAFFEADAAADAVRCYALAIRPASPLRAEALYKRGYALLVLDRPEEAARELERFCELYDSSPYFGECLFLLGEAHYRAGAFEAARAVLTRAERDLPRHDVRPKVLFRLGLACCELGAWQDAERVLAELARTRPEFPNRAEAELGRGRALAGLGREREALAAFARAIDADDGAIAARARVAVGSLHQAAGRHEEALGEFLKVALLFAHEESVAESLFRAGECLAATDRPDQAQARWRELVREHPETSWARAARERLDGSDL